MTNVMIIKNSKNDDDDDDDDGKSLMMYENQIFLEKVSMLRFRISSI